MSVPSIDLKRFEPGFMEKWIQSVENLTANASFIGGEQVSSLEEKLAVLCESDNVITCANGTDALQLALRAVGVQAGDFVVLPNLTFWATFEAVVNVGAIPITVDIDLSDGAIDQSALKNAIEKYEVKAIILVHLYGWGSANLDEIRSLSSSAGIPLIEDGAQSFGTEFMGNAIYKSFLQNQSRNRAQ